MAAKCYKKIDRSMMDWGFTLPKDLVSDFESGKSLKKGTSRKVDLIWDRKIYEAKLCHVDIRKRSSVHQIRWDNNRELLRKLRRTFIQSYVILKSQKELFDASKKTKKHFRTKLEGGKQEVLIFQPLGVSKIQVNVFIKIYNEWNELFERLADENVFGWLFDKDKKYLISRSTNWIKVKDFQRHSNATNVIYYLVNTKKRLLYIGKAEVLSKRVQPGRKHQNMPGDWDLFKYDIIKPEYSSILDKLEDHTIRSFASILKNNKKYPSLGLSSYTFVNLNWKKL